MSKAIQSGRLRHNVLDPLFHQDKTLNQIVNKADELSKKVSLYDVLEGFNFAKDDLQASKKEFGEGITLTTKERKDVIKVIKSLENRGILLKETTRKITSQERSYH